jgi:hypothetical protein
MEWQYRAGEQQDPRQRKHRQNFRQWDLRHRHRHVLSLIGDAPLAVKVVIISSFAIYGSGILVFQLGSEMFGRHYE